MALETPASRATASIEAPAKPWSRNSALAARFYRAGPGRVLAALTDYLARATARGALEIEDPRLAAEMFFGMIRGDFHMRRLLGLADHPDMTDLARLADAAVALFLKAYRLRG